MVLPTAAPGAGLASRPLPAVPAEVDPDGPTELTAALGAVI
jgi:hypothetical protein